MMTNNLLTKGELRVIADTDHVQCGDAAAMAKMLLEVMDCEPVAFIDEEGLELLDSGEAATVYSPQAWTSMAPLYRHAQPVPVVLKDHQIRELVNMLLDITIKYHGTQQLRGHIARMVREACWEFSKASFGDGWIPVTEQMPPRHHEVLVGCWWDARPGWRTKWATYIPGHPDALESGWLIPGASWTPTHWRPLPAAPQEIKHA